MTPIYINASSHWCGNLQPALPSCSDTLSALHSTIAQVAATLPPHLRRHTPLILATTKGNLDPLVHWIRQPIASPPTLSDLACDLALTHGLAHAHVVSTACSSGLTALIDAGIELLHDPFALRHILVAGVDHAGDFVCDGFNALKAISPTACRPFDQHRDGLSLGSAAGACILSREITSTTRAVITGWGIASDSVHMTAPDRHANGLIRAIQNALASAHLSPADIDLVVAHGTGTRYNDAMESVAFRHIFQNHGPAITALKGRLGHTLGASGIVEILLAIDMLATGEIPAIAGLKTPEFPDLNLLTAPRTMPLRHILKVASGFGGLNAALLLAQPAHVMEAAQ